MLLLCVVLIQGTSTSLTIAYHFSYVSSLLEPLVNMLWGLCYLVALAGLFANFGVNWIGWIVRYRLLLTLLLIGTLFSTTWSIDAYLTIERNVHLIGTTIIALYLGLMIPLQHILRATAIVFGILMFLSIAVVLFFPALGIETYEGRQVWRGVMTSKNTLGFWSTVSALLFITLMGQPGGLGKRALLGIGLVMSIIALVFSVSATSVLALIISLIVMAYLFVAFRFDLGFVPMIVMGILCVGLALGAFINIDTAELIGRSGDLTGRGEIWEQTWQLIMQKPLTGYGYGTLWQPTPESLWIQQSLTDFSWRVYHAHNGLLQLGSEIGLPLTALAVLMAIQQLIEIIYCQYHRQQTGLLFVLGFTVALLVSNYSEARLLVNRELYWIFFITLPVSMLQQQTIVPTDNFVPIPSPLSPRAREKAATNATDRSHRRELKARLRTQRLVNEKQTGRIIDVQPNKNND